jgi:hypothetical protein
MTFTPNSTGAPSFIGFTEKQADAILDRAGAPLTPSSWDELDRDSRREFMQKSIVMGGAGRVDALRDLIPPNGSARGVALDRRGSRRLVGLRAYASPRDRSRSG